MQLPILMYHNIDDTGPDALAPYRISPSKFQQQIEFLKERGYYSITLNEWAKAVRSRQGLPGRPIAITFDDGYLNFFNNAWPTLKRFGFSATMFVVTEKVGGVADWESFEGPKLPLMSWEHLRLLREAGLSIGCHTATHRDLTTLSEDEIIAETTRARSALKQQLDVDVNAIAPPWGRTDARVRRALEHAGYSIAVRTWGGMSTFDDDPLDFPRIEIFPDDDLAAFANKIEAPATESLIPKSSSGGPIPERDPSSTKEAPRPDASGISMGKPYPPNLAARLDALFGQFVSLTNDILSIQAHDATIQKRIIQIFTLPISEAVTLQVKPYELLEGGFAVGFQAEAKVLLEAVPKIDFSQSPERCSNILRIHLSGASQWLSLEFPFEWPAMSSATRYQLGIYATASRKISGRGVLRLPTGGGNNQDVAFAHFKLDPAKAALNCSGTIPKFDFAGLDSSRSPTLFFDFDTRDLPDFDMQLNYLSLYFD
jgi:peptidoglycan/xylan/chitin deacetylase (PgdA/CDA1 family)